LGSRNLQSLKLILLLSLVLLALLPALAQEQSDSPEQARRDYEVRLNRLESRAAKATNALTRADLTTTSLADRLEQTYMSAFRVVYYEDFEQATATLRPAVTELGFLVSDLEAWGLTSNPTKLSSQESKPGTSTCREAQHEA
jgi:hypothetical protein